MMTPLDLKVWKQPRWVHYVVAILLSLLAIYLRAALHDTFGNNVIFGLSILTVAVVAYVGGFLPGIISAIIGFTGSVLLTTNSGQSFDISTKAVQLNVGMYSMICLFICYLTDRLRRIVFQNSYLSEQMDLTRLQSDEVLKSITEAFYIVDKDWKIIKTNSAFDEMVSERLGSVLGKKVWELFPVSNQNPIYVGLTKCMQDRETQVFEIEDKSMGKWYQVHAYPTSQGISVFNHDITERRVFEQQREILLADERAARSQAEEESRIKEEFLAVLSHELRTPIASLSGWANLLTKATPSPELLNEGLASIDQSTRMQTKILGELLDISRINSGKLKVEMEYIDFSNVVEDAIAIHIPTAKAKSIEILLTNDVENLIVKGDTERLHQVISNLISNALKFSKRNDKIRLHMFQEGNNACCTVMDEGDGISAEFLPYVFDRFRQANSSMSRKYSGLGLGLAIAKQLIELQNGSLEVQSQGIGKGSTFTVRLPVNAPLDPVPEPIEEPANEQSLQGLKIIVVEDDDSTRLLLKRLLESLGAVAVALEDAQSTIDVISSANPDLILSDVGLPIMDGYALIRSIRNRNDQWKSVPAVALTAFARTSDRKAALAAGFDAYHTKPVDPPALIRTIVELTAGKNAS